MTPHPRSFLRCSFFVLLWLFALAADQAGAATVYVSPSGSDRWAGGSAKANAARTDGPLASLQGARDRMRAMHTGGARGPIHVVIAGGHYSLPEPLALTAEDSGAPDAPTIYEAAPGQSPVFSAGRVLTGFRPAGGGVWTAQVPNGGVGKWFFEQLWVNGRRAARARSPNQFYFYTQGKVGMGVDPATGQQTDLSRRAFRARPEDIRPLLGLTPAQLHDVVVVAYHSWEVSRLRVLAVEAKTNTVITTGPAVWPFSDWGPSQRYQLENYPQALDQPGEWYLDQAGTLFYRPLPGEDMRQAEVIAPVGDTFVTIKGTPAAKVRNITLRGLTFVNSGYTLPPEGQGDGQAAVSIPAVFQADDADHVTLENCEIAHTGLYGVWFRRGCAACRVQHCYLHDLGAGGVRLGETVIEPPGPERTGGNVVDDTIIRSDGRIFPGAIGVWIGQSGDNQVTHNDISDTYYTGISVGWSWGYGDSLARGNHIDFNRIHHIGQGVLSDMGGVYTLGISDGTTVSHNVIHDVYSYNRYGRGGWGLYNDEGSSGITLEDNLVYDVHTGGYHQHYGEKNLIQNNIFAFSLDGQLQRSRVEDRLAFTFRHNLVCWDQGPLLAGSWEKNTALDHNLYWNYQAAPVRFEGKTLTLWQALGKDAGSIVADPRFADPQKRDFRLRPGSPALALGFQPFDPAQAGVYGNSHWVHLAHDYAYPPLVLAPDPPPPPPLALHQDFESLPVGARCPEAQTNVENKGDSILVTDETAASGHHSLKFTDAPGLQNAFDPHLVFSPSHFSGVTTLNFALRVDAEADVVHEWRDWRGDPYRVGPAFSITGGKLILGGKPVLDIPPAVWVHYQIRAGIGPNANHRWSLIVTVPGHSPYSFSDLPNGTPGFDALTWLGFVSNATEKTAFYLDDLDLSNVPGPR